MSLVADLNDLLMRVRGALQAAQQIHAEVDGADQDIRSGLEDMIRGERWSSSGLYHRVTQINGTPTLLDTDLASKVATKTSLPDQIKTLCSYEQEIAREVSAVMSRNDLDETTKALLVEMRDVHRNNASWCQQILMQWQPDEEH